MQRGQARTLLAMTLGLAATWWPITRVAAQIAPGCQDPQPDGIETSPGEGARDVARNTFIRVRVPDDDHPQFQLFREVEPVDAGGTDAGLPPAIPVAVAARWERIDATEYFVVKPESLLQADTSYTLSVLTSTGLLVDPTFTTVDVVDTQAPDFAFGPDDVIGYSASRMPDACEAEPGSYLATVNVPHVPDDGADGSVEVLLYLTRAAGLEAPVLVAREYNGPDQTPLSFVLSPAQLATPVCVVADAIDGVGHHADPANIKEFCFDPLQGNFFEPCHVAAPLRPAQHGPMMVMIVVALLALDVRRRRLNPPAKGRGPQR